MTFKMHSELIHYDACSPWLGCSAVLSACHVSGWILNRSLLSDVACGVAPHEWRGLVTVLMTWKEHRVCGAPSHWHRHADFPSRPLFVTSTFRHIHFRLTSLIHCVPRAMPFNVIIWEYNSRRVQHGITLVACCIFLKRCFSTRCCLLAPWNTSHLYTGFLFWINLCHVDLSISFMPCTQPLSVELFFVALAGRLSFLHSLAHLARHSVKVAWRCICDDQICWKPNACTTCWECSFSLH